MNEVKPLFDFIRAHAPWLFTLMTLMGCVRLVLKPFNARLQAKLTELMVTAANSPDTELRKDWETVLHQRWYRILTFTLDLVLSLKLPVLADFLRVQQHTSGFLGAAAGDSRGPEGVLAAAAGDSRGPGAENNNTTKGTQV
ncbi:MAG TPA: hypothetical protein VLT16_00550 [Candidatus Limnocylindrales bacterium]|nr:hypothetical protein [Candidatus Limnocylindrales bacterium]